MKVYKVQSFTDPNTTYDVRSLPDGEWRCSCPQFVFREKETIICKHIGKVMQDLRNDKSRKKDQSMEQSQEGTQS